MRLRGLWRPVKTFALSPTGRLTASYLLVIMVMSLGFSLVLFSISAQQLQRQLPPPSVYGGVQQGGGNRGGNFQPDPPSQAVQEFLQQRIDEGRKALVVRMGLLNLVALLIGSVLSYLLARRTLQPIEAGIEAQSQFVGDASHELRTPLTTLRTSNEVALRDRHLNLAEARNLIRQNIDEVAKLQTLADGLLELAKQDGYPLPLQPVSLQDIAGEAMNRVIAQAQARRITIDDQVPAVTVQAHAPSLTQSVVVLLDNAIKYGRPGMAVQLEGGRKSRHAYLSVSDNGPGIRPSDQARIFDRFYRADQSRTSQRVAGHGIGLSLAKKIVEQHGGSLTVVSQLGKGSQFIISLPLTSRHQ